MEPRINYAKHAPGVHEAMGALDAFSEQERAARSWAEAITLIAAEHVPDGVYEDVRRHFTERELVDLTFALAAIKAWNHLSIAARLVPGSDQPAAVAS